MINSDYYNLKRFIKAQDDDYDRALREIKNGRKISHWIWYIFPQLDTLGHSAMSEFYGIKDIAEAKAYLNNEILREHLISISEALYELNNNIVNIFGYTDSIKVRSCMTLFHYADPSIEIFKKVIDKFYDGEFDNLTINKLKNGKNW
ncbi:MAG: DUF1810 domain-containing protein [Bacilli bacterium]|nr:DUF1810 domain-containing protein [Bacilli bacterium]